MSEQSHTISNVDYVVIRGTLEVLENLHVGGDKPDIVETYNDLKSATESVDEKSPTAAEFIKDVNGKAVLPASTLKGGLRRLLADQTVVGQLFGDGKENDTANTGVIGALYVSHATQSCDQALSDHVRNRISRKSGAVEHGALFAKKIAKPGTLFSFTWRFTPPQDQDDLSSLKALLNRMRAPEGFMLGSGQRLGMGRMILCDNAANPLRITKHVYVDGGYERCELHSETIGEWLGETTAASESNNTCTYRLSLTCPGPFMTHDPAKTDAPDSVTLMRGNHPHLPTSSLSGALRQKAAWYALNTNQDGDDFSKVLKSTDDPGDLTTVEQLFGVTGWQGALGIAACICVEEGEEQCISSVGIDRFTGGTLDAGPKTWKVRNGVKFDITLQLKDRKHVDEQALTNFLNGYLNYLKRDGLQLGAGAATGYGWFEVEWTGDTQGEHQ